MRRNNGIPVERARIFVRDNPGMFCDSCIRETLRVSRYHLVERDFCLISDDLGMVREFGQCSRCHERRKISKKK
jgi:hypothetical protein